MHIDWGAAATILVCVAGFYWDSRRKHNANLATWSRFLFLIGEQPLHSHREKSGALTADGVVFPRATVTNGNAQR